MRRNIGVLSCLATSTALLAGNGFATPVFASTTSGPWQDITDGGMFNVPISIAVDSNGDLFVANALNNTIEERPGGSTTWRTSRMVHRLTNPLASQLTAQAIYS